MGKYMLDVIILYQELKKKIKKVKCHGQVKKGHIQIRAKSKNREQTQLEQINNETHTLTHNYKESQIHGNKEHALTMKNTH